MTKKKGIHLILRLGLVVALLLVTAIATVQPAAASADIKLIRFPTPGNYLLNQGFDTELFWWHVTYDSTPELITFFLEDPNGVQVPGTFASWNVTGSSGTIYNPEDPGGIHEGDPTFLAFAHKWLIPAGSTPGTYTSRVRFYSAEVSGTPPVLANFEAEAAQTFFVRQPLKIFKYNDLNGNGALDTGEPGLDGWHFTVTGPVGTTPFPGPSNSFSGDTSLGGNLQLPDVAIAGAYTFTETLQSNWVNTDPGNALHQKVVNIPSGIADPVHPTVYFGNEQLLPSTNLTMSANPSSLPVGGGSSIITINEFNNGTAPITAVSVNVTSNVPGFTAFTLTKSGSTPAGWTFGGTDNIIINTLDAGETWRWTITIPITANAHFTAVGDGLDPSGAHVNPSTGFSGEGKTLDITVNPPQTPASSTLGMVLLIAGFAGIMALFIYRRARRSQS